MDPIRTVDVGRLMVIANGIAAANASFASEEGLRPIQHFLHEVRIALGMDVAFVSRFVDGRRRFEVVSVDSGGQGGVARGESDALVDTYCKLVVDGLLPTLIQDSQDHPVAASLPITQALRIRAYLSAPVVLRDGVVFGTVCCFSELPRRDLTTDDATALKDIAEAIAAAVEHDPLMTQGIWPPGRGAPSGPPEQGR